jgi:hypothetical protein
MGSPKYLYQFIPQKFEYLTKTKVIEYKGVNLKTAYLINIIHELILKFYFSSRNYMDLEPNEDIKFNLWSSILRKKYGMHYNLYMEYLQDIDFITMVSDYYVGKKAKTYKINHFEVQTIKKVKTSDAILEKKSSKEYLMQSITEYCNSPINPKLRKRLVDDLYHVQIDYDKSIDLINNLKQKGEIETNKYYKNLHSIESIKNRNLFFKFDEYGRFHTNFTILKKEIRQNYLKIDGHEISEIDIGNSQPLFLALLVQEEMEPNDPEINNYIWLARQGLFYEHILDSFTGLTRSDVKLLTYKVLFGHNGINSTENKIFEHLFPKIYKYIIEYKKVHENYKFMAHTLQKMESNFIFGKVVTEIYEKIPEMKLITIHDSILFPVKYEKQVREIFERNKKELF